MNRKAPGAFTLIELLLVMVILAVLASVAIPVYLKQAEISRVRATIADIAHVKSALASYQLDVGTFPSTEEGLDALVHRPPSAETWHGPYLEQIPPDKWGSQYRYMFPSPDEPDNYKLFSCGKDHVDYSEDDITQYTLAN